MATFGKWQWTIKTWGCWWVFSLQKIQQTQISRSSNLPVLANWVVPCWVALQPTLPEGPGEPGVADLGNTFPQKQDMGVKYGFHMFHLSNVAFMGHNGIYSTYQFFVFDVSGDCSNNSDCTNQKRRIEPIFKYGAIYEPKPSVPRHSKHRFRWFKSLKTNRNGDGTGFPTLLCSTSLTSLWGHNQRLAYWISEISKFHLGLRAFRLTFRLLLASNKADPSNKMGI